MKASRVQRGHPMGGRVAASHRVQPRPFRDGGRTPINPHPSAKWICHALFALTKDGPIDQYTWQHFGWSAEQDAYTYPPGGTYWLHVRGADPDDWLEGTKADAVVWLAGQGVEQPVKREKAAKNANVLVRKVEPVDIPREVEAETKAAAEMARAELARRKAKRAAIKAGMSKREAFEQYPPIDEQLFKMASDELKEMAA